MGQSSLIDAQSLKEEFEKQTKTKDLKVFAESQQKLIEKLVKEMNALQEKNKHLETLLLDNAVAKHVSVEEQICVEQIELIRLSAAGRSMSLEEVRKLDLLIKNLKLTRDESTAVITTTSYKNVPEDALIAIAQQSDDGEDK